MLSFQWETEYIGALVDIPMGVVEFLDGSIVTNNEFNVPLGQGVGDGFDPTCVKSMLGLVFNKNHAEVYLNPGKILNDE